MLPSTCEPTPWAEFPAFRLRNGALEAIIVPALGRLMHFARAGGENWLWTEPRERTGGVGWRNWGGDKTWLAPQASWPVLGGTAWPPDPAWGDPENGAHAAVELPAGGLRITGPVSAHSGLRVGREYRLDADELVIRSIVENVSGPAWPVALWSVTNLPPPAASYFVPSPASVHPGGFCGLFEGRELDLAHQHGLLVVTPTPGLVLKQKIGLDTPWVALAARRAGELLIQRAESGAGPYPHGARGVGSSVEYFECEAGPTDRYIELELLGPLATLVPGECTTFTTRWRIESVPPDFPACAADFARLKTWLQAPVPVVPSSAACKNSPGSRAQAPAQN